MKGQAINYDWVIGLSLFLVAMIAAAFAAVDTDSPLFDSGDRLEDRTREVHERIGDDVRYEGRRFPLIVRGRNVGRVPVDREYAYAAEAAQNGSTVEGIGRMYVEDDRVVAVPRTGNRTLQANYFLENVTGFGRNDSLEVGNWLNSTSLSVLPGSTGLESLRYDGFETLNASADLGSTNYTTVDRGLYGSSLDGRLNAYSNSSEIIVEGVWNGEFRLKNFSTLYWKANNSTTELTGTGTFADDGTSGFTVAGTSSNQYGLTFAGVDNATVRKPDNLTVVAEVNSTRLRVRAHSGGYWTGYRRLKFQEGGWIEIGVSSPSYPGYRPRVEELSGLSDEEFADRFGLDFGGFNVSLEGSRWGREIPLQTAVTRSRSLPVINKTGKIHREELRVTVWE